MTLLERARQVIADDGRDVLVIERNTGERLSVVGKVPNAVDLARFAVAVGEALPGLRREHCDHNDGGDGWGCVSLNWKDKPCDCGADATNAALDGLRAMLEDA